MKKTRPCVVGIGELLWDLLPFGKEPGGAPANFAFQVAQLGGQAFIVSNVGHASDGSELLQWVDQAGIESNYIQQIDRPTGTVSIQLTQTGQPAYAIDTDVAWDYLAWTPELEELAAQTDCVCVGTLAQRSAESRGTIQRFLRTTSADCLKIFDVNLRRPHVNPDVIRETLSLSNVLKLNEDEFPIIAENCDVSTDWTSGLLELLSNYRLRLIALTRGSLGSVLADADGIHVMHGLPVKVVDTIGAGDAFTAAMAIGLLKNDSIYDIQKSAATLSSYVCTQRGATAPFPRDRFENASV